MRVDEMIRTKRVESCRVAVDHVPIASVLQNFDFVDRFGNTNDCPSSDNLRLIRHFEKGGSGSSGVRV